MMRPSQRRNAPQMQMKVKAGVDPDDPRVRAQCTGKRFRWDSRRAAIRGAAAATKKRGETYFPYKCRMCARWHLTRRPPEDFRFRKVKPVEYNGRIGRSWEPESVDDFLIESFVDQVFALVGLGTVEYAPESRI